MRKYFLVGALLLLGSPKIFAQGSLAQPVSIASPKLIKAAAEHVELIEGKPQRKYKLLSPLWFSHKDGKAACDKIRVQAYQMNANAIIELQIGMTDQSSSFGFGGGGLGGRGGGGGGLGGSSSKPIVYCTGKAVKWK